MPEHRPSAQPSERRPAPGDPASQQLDAALLALAITLVLALMLYVALFDVDTVVEQVIAAAVVAFAVSAAVFVHVVRTPTGKLPHPAKVRRERQHAAVLAGVLLAVLLLLVYTAAFDLSSWAEWTFLGILVAIAVGAGIAVQTRLR